VWCRDETELARELVNYLDGMGLIKTSAVIGTDVHRLVNAYPVYSKDYQETAEVVLSYLHKFQNLWSLGRGGSFFYGHVHDFITDGFTASHEADTYLVQGIKARV
jgi:protoporphyrinogen oxidase